MCTAVSYKARNHYFGRNLDWEYSFGEKIIITPRNFELKFKKCKEMPNHYAMIGMGIIKNNYPLYFDATNEEGLSIAGLNFPSNAFYTTYKENKTNVTPFEFIPWILGSCKTVKEAIKLIENINFLDMPFSEDLPLTPLHWLISDKSESITVEPLKNGAFIYPNKVGVLTNNPPFEIQMHNLNNYINISVKEPKNSFSDRINLTAYSRGLGALGLPGDFSSQSRFVKASFVKLNTFTHSSEDEDIHAFFHILASVEQPKGCVETSDGKLEYTVYSSCCDTEKGVYYLKTYYGNSIEKFDMHCTNLNDLFLKTGN